ncbi:MAG: hypothetical protein QM737_10540 [Ferruginibacter sp.]
MKIIYVFILLFLVSCNKKHSPDEKFVEAVIVSHYNGTARVSELKCEYSKTTQIDSVKMVSVKFSAQVDFFSDYIRTDWDDPKKTISHLAGSYKPISNGFIQFYNVKGYWQVAELKIDYEN